MDNLIFRRTLSLSLSLPAPPLESIALVWDVYDSLASCRRTSLLLFKQTKNLCFPFAMMQCYGHVSKAACIGSSGVCNQLPAQSGNFCF